MECHSLLFQPWKLRGPPSYYRPSWQFSRIAQQQQRLVGYWSCCALTVKRAILLCPLRSLRRSSTDFVASSRLTATSALPGLQDGFKGELDRLLTMLPLHIRERLQDHPKLPQLVEIVMDLGRPPMARFPFGDCTLSEGVITMSELEQVVSLVGDFDDDNRAGIDRTLHRISAIRSRAGQIVGLTCRVGRAISGSAEIVRDLVSSGGSLLLMGPPGVGKTTAIREIARVLADECKRRVVIVDTSNEIAGEGDIPHSGIGRARRMQVPNVDMQHEVMIEAVENHMPQTIVIDEIGTELEALAAGTIAQRGVQLVGTAHGTAVENLIKNPSLQMLAGGIQSVTIGDDEARRRRIQKSILERKGPPTFTAAAEMISWNEWRIHQSLSSTVDALLTGRTPEFEVRRMLENGQVIVANSDVNENHIDMSNTFSLGNYMDSEDSGDEMEDDNDNEDRDNFEQLWHRGDVPLVLYCYQITESDLEQVMDVMALENEVQLTNNIGAADAVLTLHSKLKQNSWIQDRARLRQIPIFLIKANTMAQMVRALRAILGMKTLDSCNFISSGKIKDGELTAEGTSRWHYSNRKTTMGDQADALEEARLAVERIVIPKGQPVELLPRSLHIIALQVKLVERYQLMTEKVGTEVNLRLRILPVYANNNQSGISDVSAKGCKDYFSEDFGISGASVSRLPILPEYNRNCTNST